jgi:hypothetical protein
MVATTSTRLERSAVFDMTVLFGCSASAWNRLMAEWRGAPVRSVEAFLGVLAVL